LRWTRWRCAREVLRGGLEPNLETVSDRSAQDERRCCVRQKRVVLAPVAGVKLAEAVRTQPGSLGRQSGSDGGKRNPSPGRARHKPSNHCAGKAGCSPLDLYARVRTSCAHCTRDRGCSAHPVFPAPSRWRERNFSKPRAQGVARRRNCIHRHCERSEAIHCHLLHGKMDCFASLAMTEKAAAGDLCAVAQRAKADPVSKQATAYWMPRLRGA